VIRMRRALLASVVIVTHLVCVAPLAHADEPAFALSSGLAVRAGAVRGDTQLGASLLFDVWYPRGPVRIGAATGVVALFGAGDQGRTFAPLAVSLAVETMGPRLGFSLRFRAGMWAGATDDGLSAGSLLSGALFLHYKIKDTMSLALGVDTLFAFGHGDISLFIPALSFVYRPGTEPDEL
jgi:hypothetical protein